MCSLYTWVGTMHNLYMFTATTHANNLCVCVCVCIFVVLYVYALAVFSGSKESGTYARTMFASEWIYAFKECML